jgi:hypothetical protein
MAAAIRLSQQHSCSFDHLIGAGQNGRRDFEAECLRGRKVYDEINFVGCSTGRSPGFEPRRILST